MKFFFFFFTVACSYRTHIPCNPPACVIVFYVIGAWGLDSIPRRKCVVCLTGHLWITCFGRLFRCTTSKSGYPAAQPSRHLRLDTGQHLELTSGFRRTGKQREKNRRKGSINNLWWARELFSVWESSKKSSWYCVSGQCDPKPFPIKNISNKMQTPFGSMNIYQKTCSCENIWRTNLANSLQHYFPSTSSIYCKISSDKVLVKASFIVVYLFVK